MTSFVKFLVIGQGGREHALVRALKLSPSVREIHCMPGSDGISHDALCHPWDGKNFSSVVQLVKKLGIDVVLIGPENFLAEGLADVLRAEEILVVGPNKLEAQLESSKIFAKEFMLKAAIPTAPYKEIFDVESTIEASGVFSPPYVFKADGLAAGKGVFICKNQEELKDVAHRVFVQKEIGRAGERAFLEQFFTGWELSYLIVTNGREFEPLPLVQDHKRLLEDDQGPNTGGMGTVAPLKITPDLDQQIRSQILVPLMQQMTAQKLNYRGVLFVGMMITNRGPMVLEFNVRLGDPEAQVALPLLDGDWGLLFRDLAQGQLKPMRWKPLSAACVVLAAEGYPTNPKKDVVILGDIWGQSPSSYFLHAGTKKDSDGKWKTNGGRVLNAIGLGDSVSEALRQAYLQTSKVHWAGMQYRKDIGKKLL